MRILKGADVAAEIRTQILKEVELLDHTPTLATVRIGEEGDDIAYERSAAKRLTSYSLKTKHYVYPADISNEDFLSAIRMQNDDSEIDGILLLRPFPAQINEESVMYTIAPEKDMDGISPMNMARVFCWDERGFAPAVVEAVVRILKHAGIEMAGKTATIVGRSEVVGRPLCMLLLKENCTVTMCHTKTRDLPTACRTADILVSCAGSRNLIDRSCIKPGAVVIDVGFNVDEEGHLSGDVDFESIKDVASAATPVPGGVGGATTAILAEHLVKAAKTCFSEKSRVK